METNDWSHDVVREQVKTEDLRLEIRTLDKFIQGISAYRQHDGRTLNKIIALITADIKNAVQRKTMNAGVAQCGTLSSPQIGINQATILLEELLGVNAFLRDDLLAARAHFKKAIELEEANGHFFGPPEILKPAHELYGEFLLSTGHAEQALSNFEESLKKAPGRNHSLHGLELASRAANDSEKEAEAIKRLRSNLRHATSSPAIEGVFMVH